MTVHRTLQLVVEFYKPRMTFWERNFAKKMLDGLSGMGDVDDNQVKDFLTDKQVAAVRKIGKRFKITEKTV